MTDTTQKPGPSPAYRRALHARRAKKQRELSTAIKRARFLGLLPYVIR